MIKAAQTAFIPSRLNPIPLLYEDTHLLVLNKPTNLLSQGEHRGDPNVVDLLRIYLGRPYVGLIHRLDRNTSGLMVVAKRTKSAQRLTEALQQGRLHRTYLAWLIGTLPQSYLWRHRIKKNSRTNRVSVIQDPEERGGQEALLQVEPLRNLLWKNTPLTLAHFVLKTGRSHQIRVQSSYEGFPLLGDSKYGSKAQHSLLTFPRVALHSHTLEFPHPMSGEILSFKCPLPKDLEL